MTLKQRIGRALIGVAPVNRRTFDILRHEIGAARTRLLARVSPRTRRRLRQIRQDQRIRVNLGSGGSGHKEWVNLDVRGHRQDASLAWDIRRALPFRDGQAAMVLAEHVVEHLEFHEDVPALFREVLRVLEPGGHFRIVVPDAERWARAYANRDAEAWADLGFPELPEGMATPMMLLNHCFHQSGEHQFGWDFETLEHVLRQAGFVDVQRCEFGRSAVEGLAIDLPNHAPYSLYVEAVKPAAGLARAVDRRVPEVIGAPAVAGASCRSA